MSIRIGSAPDSWGVWFAEDPGQIGWARFLDEVSAVGYRWIELGPYGYMPTEPALLAAELERRNLRAAGTFVSFDLEQAEAWEAAEREVNETCALLRAIGAPHLILIDGIYTDLHSGRLRVPRELDDAGWARLLTGTARVVETAERYGLQTVFHPHADTHVERAEHVERLLGDLPGLSLCLDVGHFAYGGGDPVEFFRRNHTRIKHLHLKSVDADLRDRVLGEAAPFCKAVAEGVFVEPSRGVVDFPALARALDEVGYDGFAIAEQDMYPAPPDAPLPIAQRTFAYFQDLGLA